MTLPLNLAELARDPADLTVTVETPEAGSACACCGFPEAAARVRDTRLCLTCAPAFALDMPDIDRVARVVWLPHLDQGLISELVRALHIARYLAEGTPSRSRQPERANAVSRGLAALEERAATAEARIGTSQPSVLRQTLRGSLPSAKPDGAPFTGLRILSLGTWFAPEADLYSEQLRRWVPPS